MIGVLVVAHGNVGIELVEVARRIVELPAVEAVSLGWRDETELARERIARGIARLDDGQGVLILTDMFGGSPTNLALTFLEADRVEVVTGVNLPMLLRLQAADRQTKVSVLARTIAEQGQTSIYVASELLAQMKG